MLFHSSIRKELSRSFGATLVVLVTIVMSMMLIRTLGQASRGSVNPSEVTMVMGYTVLGHLPTILTLSLFIAIVSTLSRMYRDSEMVIWFASGRGLAGFLAPLFRFAWPVLLVIALLALFVWPWSNQQTQDLRDRYERRGDLERMAPGQFQESANGTRVFFVDKGSVEGQSGNNVFIASTDRGREGITSARSGRIEWVNGERFLMLSNGQRLETQQGQVDIKLSEFKEYGNKIGSDKLIDVDNVPAKARSTLALIKDPTPSHLGELAWRVGLAVAALNFVIIAIAVASVNPRAGRGGSLIFALFSFVVYYNLINLGQSWISGGKSQFASFVLLLHGSALLMGGAWLTKRHFNWSFMNLLPRRDATGARSS